MSVAALLADILAQGVTVAAVGDYLLLQGDAPPPDILRDAVRRSRPEVLAYLRSLALPPVLPVGSLLTFKHYFTICPSPPGFAEWAEGAGMPAAAIIRLPDGTRRVVADLREWFRVGQTEVLGVEPPAVAPLDLAA